MLACFIIGTLLVAAAIYGVAKLYKYTLDLQIKADRYDYERRKQERKRRDAELDTWYNTHCR